MVQHGSGAAVTYTAVVNVSRPDLDKAGIALNPDHGFSFVFPYTPTAVGVVALPGVGVGAEAADPHTQPGVMGAGVEAADPRPHAHPRLVQVADVHTRTWSSWPMPTLTVDVYTVLQPRRGTAEITGSPKCLCETATCSCID